MDLSRVYEALKNADAAGDTAAATELATYIRQTQDQEAKELKALRKEYGPGIFKTFTQGVGRGAGEFGSLVTDIIPAMAGSALGFEDYAKEQLAEAAQKRQARELEAPPVFRSYKDVEGFGDALKFGAEVIGEQIPNIATSLIPGVGGGVLAGRAALTTAGKALATQAAERGLVGEAATAFVAEGMKRAAPQVAARAGMGTNVGTFLGAYAQNAPEVFQNVFEETGQLEPGVAMLFGAGSAALDSVLPATLARQLTGPMKVGIVEKVLEKSGMDKGLLRSVTAGILKGVPSEGLTEGAQEAISIAAEKFVANNPQIFESKEWDRIMESSVRGAIAGGAFSAAGSGVERMREGAKRKQQLADALERRGQRQEAARLRAEVAQAEAEIAAIESGEAQGQLPGMEVGPYTSLFTPAQVSAEAKKQGKQKAAGVQREFFDAEGKLTKAAEKAATADEKRTAIIERQRAQREAAAQKEAQKADQLKLKKLLAAQQLTLPGFSEEEIAATRQREADVQARIAETGQGDLFGGMPPAPTTAPAPAPAPIPGVEGTIISDTKAFGKQLGVGPTAKMLKAVAGKDLSNPADVAEVRQILEAYASGKPAVGAAEKIEAFLNRPEFQIAEAEVPSEPTTRPDVGAVGAGVPSVSEGAGDVGGGGAPAVGESIGLGLGETGDVTGQPATGEERVRSALTSHKQRAEFARALGSVVPQDTKLRGRANLPAQRAVLAENFSGVLDALEKSKNKLVAEIARRARGLKTRIGIDKTAYEQYEVEDTFANQRSIDGAKMHLGLLEALRELAPVVDQLPEGSQLPFEIRDARVPAFEKGKERGRISLGYVAKFNNSMFAPLGLSEEQAKLTTKEDFQALLDAFERVTQDIGEDDLRLTSTASARRIGAQGAYDPKADKISVTDEFFARDETVLAHEIVHAQVLQAVANPTPAQRPAVQRLNKLYEHVKSHLESIKGTDAYFQYGRPLPYGVTSVQEFISEGMANPEFQYMLSRIPYENTTVWDKFVAAIAEILGLKNDNALTELLTVYSDLTQQKPAAKPKKKAKTEAPAAEAPAVEEAETPIGGLGGMAAQLVTLAPAGAKAPRAPKKAEPPKSLSVGLNWVAPKKLSLPVHRGPDLDSVGKDLAISGDLRGLIDHLQARTTNPIVRGMLAKIKRLNLKTKIVVRNPEGPMALRTPEFQRWFGDSKVVDENGNPLVVYHGTKAFEEHGDRKGEAIRQFAGLPNWFAEEAYTARGYTGAEGTMYPVYLSIKNPLTITNFDMNDDAMFAYALARRLGVDVEFLYLGRDAKAYNVVNTPQFVEAAQEAGYDGIKVKEGGYNTYAAFEPTQIKSAIGNVGTYDPNNPDIRYASNKAGSFDPRTNTIALDPDNGLNEHTVLHELMHAAISHVLRNPSLPITKQLTELFDGIRGQMGTAYGAQDIQEFTSELFSNPEFQALLKEIKAPKSGSLFKRIVQALANFFGFTKGTSAYDRGMKLINDALDISADVEPSVSDMMFLGTPNLMREAFNVVGDIGRAMPSLAGRTVESTKNSLSNAPSDLKSMALSLLRLDNLNTIYGKELPSIQTLTDNIELRNGMQEKAIAEINKNYKFFAETQKKFPAQFKVMEDMAYDARLEMADPKDPDFLKQTGLSAKQQQEYRRLRNIYNSLPADVRKTYDMIRDAYTKAIDDYEAMLVGDPDKGIPGLVDSSVAAKLKLQFQAKKRQIAYIPFLRRGDFWVEYDIDGERAASAFQSIRERDRFIRQELAPKGVQYRMYQNIENQSFQQGTLPPTSFIVGVMADLNKQGASQEIKDNVYQAYLALFPAASISKNFMKADNVRGMERDVARGYAETMVKWSRKLANTKYAGPINQAFDAIDGEAEAVNDPSVYAAAQNIRNRQNFINNPTYNKLTSAATSLSYFTFIAGNVSSALVNLSTLPLFAWPMLGGRFGFDKATFALTGATKIASMYALKKKVPGKYARLFDVLNDHAQLEHTMAREVLEGRRQTTADYLGFKARVMDLISKPFHISEVMNRGATAIAAYELALKGNPALKIPAMNEADAIRYALSAVKDMNTSGLSASASTYMQHPLGRVMLTFKSFAWNQAALIARAFHQSVKGESPEVRKEAFRQLVGTYGMAMALAGANGMPFMGAASVLANMINALLGDDDEPFDFDVLMRQWTNELFYKGLPNYFLNLEVSNRIGVANDLLFRDDPRGVAEDGYVMTALRQLAGPLGSYAVGVENGAKLMREGNVQRGIEAVLPSFLRNALKGARYMSEGALTLKGDPIVDDVSVYNGVMQMLGFTPADLSLAYEDVSMRKGYEREILAQRKRLLDKNEIARTTDDYDLMEEVREEIARFNDRRIDPKARISSDTLRRSIKAREAAEKSMINGVRFNKRLMPEITDLLEEE